MATINDVHHLNFVVRDLEKSSLRMSRILDQDPVYDELPNRQVNTARFELNGIWIVLVEPVSKDSEVARILAARGEGLFLLSLGVANLEVEAEALNRRGVTLNASGARKGLLDWRVWDLALDDGLGPVIQLCESSADSN